MLTKFESKSNRVKGLSFHPIRPWILASLHNGIIQLWDYQMGTLLDRFDEHDGPVRGVDFHKSQPLIVSGGDDYKIKVWDYKLRRCLFTLLGHLDYIRTVQFHNEYPWIVSASDDQTIRIWNWQSRSCVSVLTGHNHYVMCASFHPKDDLIVSASLDQTVRVWDISGLRKKTVRGAPAIDETNMVARMNADIFGSTDAVVKYVLEGHDRGVNWAAFHPTLPLVISGADDRQVKLWRMNETKAWEVDTMRGHTNNVSCAIFHPKHELIISNSEDRSIRVWDISKRMGVQTFRRENDRFWILAAHPEANLLAAGHDSGMIVFKLERERPAYAVHEGRLFYVKERYLRMLEFANGRDLPVVSLRRAGQGQISGLGGTPRSLQYNVFNPQEANVLLQMDTDGGTYELLTFTLEASAAAAAASAGQTANEPQDLRRGSGLAAAFVSRNRFAVLDKNRQILIKNFQNETTKKISPPNPSTDSLFFGGISGRLLLKSEDRVILFEQESRRVLGEAQIPRVKYIFWNSDCSLVALVSKHAIVLASRQLEQLCSVSEAVRVKSGGWDDRRALFVYSTLNHVKYALPNGDTGILRTLEAPVYITKATCNQALGLDRECKMRTLELDCTEALFKLALEAKQYGEVMQMVKHSRLCGQAIINYLQDKGFPEVALHFVQDQRTRFKLALACGDVDVAISTAYDLNDDEAWRQLGNEALKQGKQEVVEMAYQRCRDLERLSFLYLLLGKTEKLKKMQLIATKKGDVMSRFHNALYLGDAAERMQVLESAGQVSLAYLTAATHGLEEDAARLKAILEASGKPVPMLPEKPVLLQPPTPILRQDDWPQCRVTKSTFADYMEGRVTATGQANPSSAAAAGAGLEDAGTAWDDDLDLDDDGDKGKPHAIVEGEGAGWGGDDLDIDDDDLGLPKAPAKAKELEESADAGFSLPAAGAGMPSFWVANSSHAADHVAAGSFESAMQLLNRQIAAVNFQPLKKHFMRIYTASSCTLPGLPSTPSNRIYLCRNAQAAPPGTDALPVTPLTVNGLIEDLKLGYRQFHAGNFNEAQAAFVTILHAVPLTVANTRSEANEIKEMVEICREYITAIRLKTAIAATEDPVRQMELSAYFTHSNLQPGHLLLALRLAMANTFKYKNYITAASCARRLLELPDVSTEKNAELKSKAQKVLQKSEQMGSNEHTLNYDERNPFNIDCQDLVPIYRGSAEIQCPFCSSRYSPAHQNKLCATCNISQVGVETIGLVSQVSVQRRS